MSDLSRANYTILIVDDLDANLFALRQMLLPLGVNIKTALSAEEGLKYLLNNKVDILLLDYSMPMMSGVEMAEHVNEHFNDPPPILFVTAHGHNVPGLESICYESGAIDFIEKPVKEHVLLSKLKILLKLIEQKAELERLARVDNLTGLKNRRAFYEALDQTLSASQRNGNTFAVLAIDLDEFKPVNDSYGHDAGDQLLKVFSDRLKQSVRISDTAARLGGDEFSVILSNVDSKEEAAVVANKIKQTCAREFTYQGQTIPVKLSIGIAFFPLHGDTTTDLMKAADMALYQAKGDGKGKVHVLRTDEFDSTEQLDDKMTLQYQPVVNSNNQVMGGEVLTKLNNSSNKQGVSRAIEQFRKNGFSKLFEQALCNKITHEVTEFFHTSGKQKLLMFVNQNINELLNHEQIENLLKLYVELKEHNIELVIDLIGWESANERSHIMLPLKHLAATGISLCIQDVGETIIPCALVEEVDITYLKYSRNLMKRLVNERHAKSMVKAIATLAESYNCTPIAVGVETKEQLEILESLGCSLFQGFLFDHAMPGELFEKRRGLESPFLHVYG
jgi:diguanylate cyclase